MGKLSLAGVALVAAVPAGFVAYLLIMQGLLGSDPAGSGKGNFETISQSVFLQVIVVLTLLVCLVPLAMPPVFLVQHFLAGGAGGATKKGKNKDEEPLDESADDESLDEAPLDEAAEEPVAEDELADAGLEESGDLVEASAGDELTEMDDLDLGGLAQGSDDDFDSTETAEWQTMDDDDQKA